MEEIRLHNSDDSDHSDSEIDPILKYILQKKLFILFYTFLYLITFLLFLPLSLYMYEIYWTDHEINHIMC